MKKKKVVFHALWEDLTHNKILFLALVLLIFVCNLVVFFTELTLCEFKQSIELVRNQLGADIIVVSSEYDENLKEALFSGIPSSFSFHTECVQEIEGIEGVKELTSTLFVSSLDSSCCEEQVEFVIYNDQDNFVITSFIEEYDSKMNKRDIIIGSDIDYQVGDDVTYFGCIFHVAAKLRKTGMGYDQCIFANQSCGESISTFLEMQSFENKASMILIQKEDGTDLDTLCEKINGKIQNRGLVAYKTLNLYSDLETRVLSIQKLATCYIVFLLFIAIVAIFVITVMDAERKSKYAMILMILGVDKSKAGYILLLENQIITIMAAIAGNVFGMMIIIIFRNYIENTLGISINPGKEIGVEMITNVMGSMLLVMITTMVAYVLALPKIDHFKRKLT